MSREKQIEIPEDEIGTSGYSKLAWKLWQELKLPMTQCETIDRIVRDEGYRKQSEGEWLTEGGFFMEHICSVCGYSVDYLYQRTPYCPNCGAKIKGGAE